MSSDLAEIIGAETQTHDDGPRDALIGFYRAFNIRDVNGLAANWADLDVARAPPPVALPAHASSLRVRSQRWVNTIAYREIVLILGQAAWAPL
jgi:hypothetical protein